ncbi:MAG: WAP domain-containing protein [Polyangiaceae bacterium]
MPRSRRLRPTRVIALTALCGFTVWACGGSDKEKIQAVGLSQGCTLNSDCLDPLVCTFARCHAECSKDRDCPGEQRCVKSSTGYVCQLKVETDCTKSTAVCKGTQQCGEDGECRDTCTDTTDCTTGQVCATSGECASTEPTKDIVDDTGAIQPDTFVDPDVSSSGGSGGASGKGGATGKGGTATTNGGTDAGGAGGDAPVSSGGTVTTGSGGKATTGTGGKAAGGAATVSGGTTSTGGTGEAGAGGSGPFTCPTNTADCQGPNTTDCETLINLQTSCGACDIACMSAHGTSVCDQATLKCVVVPKSCATGYADCNASGVDGCEVALATDPKNCGTCGRDCGGAECNASKCDALTVFDPKGATTLSYSYSGDARLVGNRIVKLNTDNGTELRTAVLPTTATTLQGAALTAATSTTAIYSIYTDATNVYYAIGGSILTKPVDAAATAVPKTAVTMPTTSSYALALDGNATALYILNNDYRFLTAAKTTAGNAVTAPIANLATARSYVSSFVVANNTLYWAENPNSVYAFSLATGTVAVQLDTYQSGYYSYVNLATDGTHVYWNSPNGDSGKMRRIAVTAALAPASVEDVALQVANQTSNSGLALDAKYLYYNISYTGIYRVIKDGSLAPELLGSASTTPYFYNLFGVDDSYVYGTGSAGQVVAVSKLLP